MSETHEGMEHGTAILAIHIGDMYVRAAWQDAANAPTNLEDAVEFQRYATPSLISIDRGGALLGYQAQMAATGGQSAPLLWRYSRAGLQENTFVARDAAGRGLTSAAFTALAARRLVEETSAWLTSLPDVVLVVPDKLSPLARLDLSTLVADAVQRPISICGEDQALLSGLDLVPLHGKILVASFDDDALRLRVVAQSGLDVQRLAAQTVPGLGMQSLRKSWFARWNADAGELLPGSRLFDHGESMDFEKIWQDIWQCVDSDARFGVPMPTWTLVRNSTVIPLSFPRAVAQADMGAFVADLGTQVDQVLATAACPAHSIATVILVAPAGLGRIATQALCKQLGIDSARVRLTDASVYAQGAARWHADVGLPGYGVLSSAPFRLGALGASKDEGGVVVKPLIDEGTPLPASASFSIMANPDVQRRLMIKLAGQQTGGQPELRHQVEFGPLQGQGMLRVKVNVVWTQDGRIHATAVDAETELSLPTLDACDVVPTGPVLGSVHVRQLD